jgi:hypothetical protein
LMRSLSPGLLIVEVGIAALVDRYRDDHVL